ncbi:hypothetical protein ACFO8N_09460 [Sneathiella chungangensis]|nr:hypothetical protein [Sneathiella chungangensis]
MSKPKIAGRRHQKTLFSADFIPRGEKIPFAFRGEFRKTDA